MKFYLSVPCGNCDEDIIDGPNLTTLEHDELPVVPIGLFEQETFTCPNCSAKTYTGEMGVMVAGGETDPGDDEDDEDDD